MHRFAAVLSLTTTMLVTLHASEHAMGSKDYFPSPDRPIGWRGDGTGSYPGATPVSIVADGPVTMVETPMRAKVGMPTKNRRTGKFPPAPVVGEGPSKNIVWATRMPGWANSQPIIVGDKAITVAEPNCLVCVDMNSGQILWQAANNPWELAGVPAQRAALIEAYVARIYAARVPLASLIGNYRRLPSKSNWRSELNEKLKTTLDQVEVIFKRLIDEHPDGAKAQEHFEKFKQAKARALATKDGNFKKGLGGDLDRPLYDACNWIVKAHKIPVLYGWDGFIGWTFATPISDGQRIYASMGQGQIVAYDLQGKRLWGTHLKIHGKHPKVGCRHVPSPLLADGVLVVQGLDQLAGVDTTSGKILWTNPKVSVGKGYNVSTGNIATLANGQKVIVTPRRLILDPQTGATVGQLPGTTYGAEGGGASIIAKDDMIYLYMAGQGRTSAMTAFRLEEKDGVVMPIKLWANEKCKSSEHSPVLHNNVMHTFSRGSYAINVTDGRLMADPARKLGLKNGSASPIIAGDIVFTLSKSDRKGRTDKRNVFAAGTATVDADGQYSSPKKDNYLEESEPAPHPWISAYAPEIYEYMAADTKPIMWSGRAWPNASYFGKCGAIPWHEGAGGFCASGNRIVLRTLSRLICIGNPEQPYDWNPASAK